MRDRVMLKTNAICLLVLAGAACRAPAGNNAFGNQTNTAYSNETVPAAEENIGADSNAAANYAADTDTGGATPAYRSYRAFGTEPYWSLAIGGGRMRYQPAEGYPVGEPLPARTPIANGYRYSGRRMAVEVVHRTCHEAGEESYPDEVKVTVNGRTLEGCGGTPNGELG